MDINYILFDLDGTLTDPSKGITNSVIYALNKWEIEENDYQKLCSFIGPPLIDSFINYYNFSKEKALLTVDYFREYFSVKGLFENNIYVGIKKLLEKLYNKNIKIILATSKPEIFAKQILEHFDIAKYFTFIAGATINETRTDKEEVIEYALKECNITDVNTAVMVGDRKYDILGGKALGLKTIGLLYGFGSLEEIETANPDYIAETVEELEKILL
jgi:phosphoglycolate phosphatase